MSCRRLLVNCVRALAMSCPTGGIEQDRQVPAHGRLTACNHEFAQAQTDGPGYGALNLPAWRNDVTALLTRPGAFSIEWDYTDGAHALTISRTALLADGEAIASDEHSGNTGASDRGNVYHLRLDGLREGATYEIVASVTPRGGTDSLGDVWLFSDDER